MDFPTTLGCFLEDGYKNVEPQGTQYLGNRSKVTKYPTILVRFLLKDDASAIDLKYWWNNHIDNGLSKFNVTLPFFGNTAYYSVEAINDLEITLQKEGYVAQFSIQLLGLGTP